MPKNFQTEWKLVKDNFIKRAREVPPEFGMALSLGNDLGPALKAFDAAGNFDARMKAMPKVMRAKIGYERDINETLKITKSRIGRAGLTALMNQIDRIFAEVEAAAQPPRPSGQMVPTYKLRDWDLAAGVKPIYLKIDPIMITVEMECDKVFKELLDAKQAGIRAQDFGDAAITELQKLRVDFGKVIMSVDAKIGADMTLLAAKTKEVNEVLRYYGKLVQDNVDRAVQTAWKEYLGRRTDLSEFRVASATKVVLGSIGVAVAVASAVLTFGVAWMNILAACKGVVDIAKSIKTWSEEIDTVWEKLIKDIEGIAKLNAQRDAAKKSGKGQKASKAKQVGKEAVAAVLPFAKDLVSALSATESRVKQFRALISKLEGKTDELSGRIDKITSNLNGSPDRMLTTSQINLQRRMKKTLDTLFTEIGAMHLENNGAIEFAKAAQTAVDKLNAEDTWTGKITKAGGVGSKGTAIYAASNFCVECAMKGKQLISLLPV